MTALKKFSKFSDDNNELIGIHPDELSEENLNLFREKSPLTAIKAHCTECCGGSIKEASKCTATGCNLWAFRLGFSPFAKHKTHNNAGDNLAKWKRDVVGI